MVFRDSGITIIVINASSVIRHGETSLNVIRALICIASFFWDPPLAQLDSRESWLVYKTGPFQAKGGMDKVNLNPLRFRFGLQTLRPKVF